MRLWLISFAAVLALMGRASAQVPVLAGGDGADGACTQIGEVVGLQPGRDGFLSVRTGPNSRSFPEIDRVFNGQRLSVCEQRGGWLGVVYGTSSAYCGLDTPRAVRQPYTGPCRYGWVAIRYVQLIGLDNRASPSAPSPFPQQPSAATTSCDDLWTQRNGIYKEAGYCFKTPRAIQTFGNAGCMYDNLTDVPLSDAQRRLVGELVDRERMLVCPR